MQLRTLTAALIAGGIALAGAHAAEGKPAKRVSSQKVLKRAFSSTASTILHLRTSTDASGIGTFTDDLWMHVNGSGAVDAVRELRLDGAYAGEESVFSQPNGLGNPQGAVGRTRNNANDPIRTFEGVAYGEATIANVIGTALKAASGDLELSGARPVIYEGRAAYEITIREASGRPGRRSPAQVDVKLWLDRTSLVPIAARWGSGRDHWRTASITAFEQLPGDAAHQPLLNFG